MTQLLPEDDPPDEGPPRILDQRIGVHGRPIDREVPGWRPVLAALMAESGSSLPDPRAGDLATMALRFSRPDGSAVFGPGAGEEVAPEWRRWSRRLRDPGIATVCRWWFGGRAATSDLGPPPLPAFGHDRRPLAVLRADWAKDGDLLAMDHRDRSRGGLLELMLGGRPILGPSWGAQNVSTSAATLRFWTTGAAADCVEWSFRQGSSRVLRTAVMLRGRKLALLAEEWRGLDGPASTTIGLHPGVIVRPVEGSRSLSLKPPAGPATIRVIPLTLPMAPYTTDRGSLEVIDGGLRLTQRPEGARAWMPLLVSWDPARARKVPSWRVLTVSEKSSKCAPEVASAARVSWGPGESYVVYRSLGRAANRAFLGHQTHSRFLVGRFTESGDVVPILKVD